MKNKGFTLVELLAVIAVLGILAIVVTPAIIGLRNNVLKSTLDTKISTINTAAADYAYTVMNQLKQPLGSTDNYYIDGVTGYDDSPFCKKVKIGTLIELNFLTVNSSHQDEERDADGSVIINSKASQILNPLNNESMNDLEVCMRFDTDDAINRKIVTYIINQCDLYNRDSDIAACLNCSNGVQETNGHWTCKP